MRLPFLPSVLALSAFVLLTGCSSSFAPSPAVTPGKSLIGNISGKVYGGHQPIVGAHIYVFAAGTGGYGTASTSLITDTTYPDTTTFSGQTIYYEKTDSNGNFQVGSDYTCTVGTQVYLYASGGIPGGYGTNANAGLLAGLGQCPAGGSLASVTPTVDINEVSTIAFAYAMAGYASDAVHVSSSDTTLANTGIANAMANIPNIISVSTGTPYTTSIVGSGTVPQSKINALANVLAACIDSSGYTTGPGDGSACGTLFQYETSSGTATTCTTPPCGAGVANDTATAAIYMAQNPWNANSTVFNLGGTTPPFLPADSSDTDFAIGVTYAFTGTSGGSALVTDASGNLYASAPGQNRVEKYTSLGVSSIVNGVTNPQGMAIDSSGNVWVTDFNANVTEVTPDGSVNVVTPTNSGSDVLVSSAGIAFDASGNMWITDANNADVVELSSSGTYITAISGGGMAYPNDPAFDSSSNLWIADDNSSSTQITEVSGGVATAFANIDSDTGTIQVAVDSNQNVWASSSVCSCVIRIANGASTGNTVALPTTSYDLSVDGGNKVFVGSHANAKKFYEISSAATALTGSNGFVTSFNTTFTTADISGNVWVLGKSYIEQFLGMGTPTSQPLTPATAGTAP